jgi:6-phosphofructokinase 1
MKTIAVLTSGGDAPGMNAAIRAATRTALNNGVKMLGSLHGYRGLVRDEFIDLDASAIRNIVHRGGSIIRSARSDEFETKEGRAKAIETCRKHKIEGLVLIGGDGTMKGAKLLAEEGGPPAVGVPGTIDNDIKGIDYTIGFDSAVNTALRAIDQIRDTAEAMERMFFIETMGRRSGAIALASGIAGGGNVVVVPEMHTDIEKVVDRITADHKAGATSLLVIVAEGDESGGAYKLAEKVGQRVGIDTRVTVLGHVQRGGNPTAQDRILATCLASRAVKDLMEGTYGHLLGWRGSEMVRIPFAEAETSTISLFDQMICYAGTLVT